MQLAYVSPPDQARRLQEESLALFREVGHQWGEAFALQAIGLVALEVHDFAIAEWGFAQSLALCQQLNIAGYIRGVLSGLSWAKSAQNKFADVRQLASDMLAHCRQPAPPVITAQNGNAAADLLITLGRFAEGGDLAEESLAMLEPHKLRHLIPLTLALRSRSRLHLGAYNAAREDAETVLRLAKPFGDHPRIGEAQHLLSRIALLQGDLVHALQLADDSLTLTLVAFLKPRMDAISIALRATVLLLRQHTDAAGQQVRDSLGLAISKRDYLTLINVLPVAALWVATEGRFETAVELYSLASKQPFVGESAWFKEVFGSRIHTLATSALSTSTIASVQARGRELDLWQTSTTILAALSNAGPE